MFAGRCHSVWSIAFLLPAVVAAGCEKQDAMPKVEARYIDTNRKFSIQFPMGWGFDRREGGALLVAVASRENDDDAFANPSWMPRNGDGYENGEYAKLFCQLGIVVQQKSNIVTLNDRHQLFGRQADIFL